MKFNTIQTALLTLLAVLGPAAVSGECYKSGNGRPKEPIWWLKQAMVAAQRVERHGWIDPNQEFWTSGRPGSVDGKTGGACIGLGVKNHDQYRIKLNAEYALNHWLSEFTGCDNGGKSTADKVEFFYQTNCGDNQHKTDELKSEL